MGEANPQALHAPMPREHGAWGLLLQPFLAGAVLAGQWTWLLVPALGLVLLGFLLREPLTVMARHRWVWRRDTPAQAPAKRWAVIEIAGVLVCFAILARSTALLPLLGLAAVAGVMTAAAVWMTMRNRQRSIPFQLVSAAGLSTTALLAALVSTGGVPGWAWWLWGLLTAHAMASILVVHARLKARTAPRGGGRAGTRNAAVAAQIAQVAGAIALAGGPLALPLIVSAVANGAELWRLRTPLHLQEALTRVGYRTLAVALVHMAVTIACLWPIARG
jgi:sulfopyruvate decarboxylase TPP-binding subunit